MLLKSLLGACTGPQPCKDTHAGWTASDATPVPSRPSSAWDDPKVQQGLYKIAQLDRCLMEKAAAATIVSRETFPEDWEEVGRKRSQRAQTQLAAIIARSVAPAFLRLSTAQVFQRHRSMTSLTPMIRLLQETEALWSRETLPTSIASAWHRAVAD